MGQELAIEVGKTKRVLWDDTARAVANAFEKLSTTELKCGALRNLHGMCTRALQSWDAHIAPNLARLRAMLLWDPVQGRAALNGDDESKWPELKISTTASFASEITPSMTAQWRQAQRCMRTQDMSVFSPASENPRPRKAKAAAAAAAAAADDNDGDDDVGGLPEERRSKKELYQGGMTASLRNSRRAVRFWLQRGADGQLLFPDLAPIALLIHSAPLGIAAVERSFNDLRTIQSRRRLNLSHANREVEAYLCYNRHLLHGLVLLPDTYFLPMFAL
jgi:hypothetical protein